MTVMCITCGETATKSHLGSVTSKRLGEARSPFQRFLDMGWSRFLNQTDEYWLCPRCAKSAPGRPKTPPGKDNPS